MSYVHQHTLTHSYIVYGEFVFVVSSVVVYCVTVCIVYIAFMRLDAGACGRLTVAVEPGLALVYTDFVYVYVQRSDADTNEDINSQATEKRTTYTHTHTLDLTRSF